MIPQKNPLIASGESVHANMFFKLWENPNPSATFAAQPITLSSSDYDFVLLIGRLINGSARDISVIAPKGDSAYFVFSTYSSGAAHSSTRLFTYTDDTHLAVSDASVDSSTNNAYLIPVAIYGFKKSLDITAIVSNVSTDATKCILSDNVTNVDDAIDGLTWKYLDTTTGNAEIAIPANATEVYARAFNSSTSCSFHFLTVENDISVDRASGYYATASSYFSATFMWTKSTRKAKMYAFSFAGTDYTSTTTTKWYYKTK